MKKSAAGGQTKKLWGASWLYLSYLSYLSLVSMAHRQHLAAAANANVNPFLGWFAGTGTPDGFSGSNAFSALQNWTHTHCTYSTTLEQEEWWDVSPNTLGLAMKFPPPVTVVQARSRRTCSIDNVGEGQRKGAATVRAWQELQLTLSGAGYASSTQLALVGLEIAQASLDACEWFGAAAVPQGSITPQGCTSQTGQGCVVLHDWDLFDGRPAGVFVTSGSDPNENNVTTVAVIAAQVADPNILLGSAQAMVGGTSCRNCFLPSNCVTRQGRHSVAWQNIDGASATGTFVSMSNHCSGAGCAMGLQEQLTDVILQGLQKSSCSPKLLTVESSLVSDWFLTSDSLEQLSLVGVSQALFSCESGYVFLEVRFAWQVSDPWPIAAIRKDLRPALFMAKAVPSVLQARLAGRVMGSDAGEVWTFSGGDLFKAANPGLFATTDVDILDEQHFLDTIGPLFTGLQAAQSRAVSQSPATASFLRALLPTNSEGLRAIWTRYIGDTNYPTLMLFLEWYANEHAELTLLRGQQDGYHDFLLCLHFQLSTLTLAPKAQAAFDAALATLTGYFNERYSGPAFANPPTITQGSGTSQETIAYGATLRVEWANTLTAPTVTPSSPVRLDVSSTVDIIYSAETVTSAAIHCVTATYFWALEETAVRACLTPAAERFFQSPFASLSPALEVQFTQTVSSAVASVVSLLSLLAANVTSRADDFSPLRFSILAIDGMAENGVAWSTLIDSVQERTKQFKPGSSNFELSSQLEAAFNDVALGLGVSLRASVLPDGSEPGALRLTLSSHSLFRMAFDPSYGQSLALNTMEAMPLDRLDIPTLYTVALFTILKPSANAAQSLPVDLEARAEIVYTHWVLPSLVGFTMGVAGMDCQYSSVDILVRYPLEVSLSVNTTVRSPLVPGPFQVWLIASNLSSELMQQDFASNIAEVTGAILTPRELFHHLKSALGLPQNLWTGWVGDVKVPPLSDSLRDLSHYLQPFSNLLNRLIQPSDGGMDAIFLLQSAEMYCLGPKTRGNLTFLVNQEDPFLCSFHAGLQGFPSSGSFQSFVDALNHQFGTKGCGFLSTFVQAVVLAVDQSSPSCGLLALKPVQAGLVYSFGALSSSFGSESTDDYLLDLRGVWYSPDDMPIFSCWEDLARALSRVQDPTGQALSAAFRVHASSMLASTLPDMVPEDMKAVWNQRLPALSVELRFATYLQVYQPSIGNVSGSGVAIDVERLGTSAADVLQLEASVATTLTIVFDGPPSGSDDGKQSGFISIHTNFTNQGDITTVKTVASHTTLDVEVAYLDITENTQEQKTCRFRLDLEVGLTYQAALDAALAAQLENLGPVAAIFFTSQDESLSSDSPTQVMLCVNRTQVAPDHFLIPIALKVENSTLANLPDGYLRPSRTFPFLQDLSQEVSMNWTLGQDSPAKVSGSLGVLGITGDDLTASVALHLQCSFRDSTTILSTTSTTTSLTSESEQLFENFQIQVDVQASVRLSNIRFESPITFSLDPDFGLALSSKLLVPDVSDVDAWSTVLLELLSNFTMDIDGSDQLQRLLDAASLTTSLTLCQVVTVLDDNLAVALGSSASNAVLPFFDFQPGTALHDLFKAMLGELKQQACAGQLSTVSMLCAAAEAWNLPCKLAEIDEWRLLIVFESARACDYPRNFYLDLERYFGSSSQGWIMPRAEAISTTLVRTNTSSLLAISVGLPDLTVELQPGSFFATSISILQSGQLDVIAGPLFFPLGEMTSQLHGYLIAEVQSSGLLEVFLDGDADLYAAAKAGTDTLCSFEVGIPSLLSSMYTVVDCDVPDIGGLSDVVANLMLELSFVRYLVDSNRFWDQISNGIVEFVQDLFGPAGPLWRWLLPLVKEKWAYALDLQLRAIVGPDVASKIVAEISHMASELLQNASLSSEVEEMEQLALDGVTQTLCKFFQPLACPPSPRVADAEKRWPLTLGTNSILNILDLSASLGDHALLSLQVQCNPELRHAWQIQCTLVYNQTHGMRVEFDRNPVLNASAGLHLVDCHADATIGPLACELTTNGIIDANLTVNKQSEAAGDLVVEWALLAKLTGSWSIGFGGLLSGVSPSIRMLPYWEQMFEMSWSCNNRVCNNAPTFTTKNGHLCLGQGFGNLLGGVLEKLKMILDPLEPYLGRSGMLRTSTGDLGNFLRIGSKSTADLAVYICRYWSSGCNIQNLYEAFQAYDQLQSMYSALKQMASVDGGCYMAIAVRDYVVDWTLPDPQPEEFGNVNPNLYLYPGSGISAAELQSFQNTYSTATRNGPWGVNCPLLSQQELAKTFVKLIMKQEVTLATFEIPAFVIEGSYHVSVPVWSPPEIWLGFDFFWSLRGKVRPFYSSRGIWAWMQNKRASSFLLGLGFVTKDKGAMLPMVAGSMAIRGSVSVGASLGPASVAGIAWITLQLDAAAAFMNPTGGDKIYVDQIVWLIKTNGNNPLYASTRQLSLSLGFGIGLEACVSYFFGRSCWGLTAWEWSTTLWSDTWSPQTYQLPCTEGGTLKLALISPSFPRLEITGDRNANGYIVALVASGPAGNPNSDDSPKNVAVQPPRFTADSTPSTPYEMELQNVRVRADLPSSPGLTVILPLESYGSSEFAVSRDRIIPSGCQGIFVKLCKFLQLVQPFRYTKLSFIGGACGPVNAAVEDTTSVVIDDNGDASAFKGKPITLSGEAMKSIEIRMNAQIFNISCQYIRASNGFSLGKQFASSNSLTTQVRGPSSSTKYYIESISANETLGVQAGPFQDFFDVWLLQVKGWLYIDAGAGYWGNTLTVCIDRATALASQAVSFKFIISPSRLVLTTEDAGGRTSDRLVTHASITDQVFNIFSPAQQKLEVTVVTPRSFTTNEIHVEVEEGGSKTIALQGCESSSKIEVFASGQGTLYYLLGQAGRLDFADCTIDLHCNERGQKKPSGLTCELQVDASGESRDLTWEVLNGYMEVSATSEASKKRLRFNHENVDRLVLKAGNGTSFLMKSGTSGSEMMVQFPSASSKTNYLRVEDTKVPVLFVGDLANIDIGPKQEIPDDKYKPRHPLASIVGSIALLSTNDDHAVPVSLVSGSSPGGPTQRFNMDAAQGCLLNPDMYDAVNAKAGTCVNIDVPPISDWMCTQRQQLGLHCIPTCQVAFPHGPAKLHFIIHTSDADGDELSVRGANDYVTVDCSLGPGSDRFTSTLPIPKTVLLLGSTGLLSPNGGFHDGAADLVTLANCPGFGSPSIQDEGSPGVLLIQPVGSDGETLIVQEVGPGNQDSFRIGGTAACASPTVSSLVVTPLWPAPAPQHLRSLTQWLTSGDLKRPTSAAASSFQQPESVVVINVTLPYMHITYVKQPNTTFYIKGYEQDTTLVFEDDKQAAAATTASAGNCTVWLDARDLSKQLFISVQGTLGDDTTMKVSLPALSQAEIPYEINLVEVLSVPNQRLLGISQRRVAIVLQDVDHLQMVSEQQSFRWRVEITRDHAPDLVAIAPDAGSAESTVEVWSLSSSSSVLVVNATVWLGPGALSLTGYVVTVGPRTATHVELDSHLDQVADNSSGFNLSLGCLAPALGAPTTPEPSLWFLQELSTVGAPGDAALACVLYVHHTAILNLSVGTSPLRLETRDAVLYAGKMFVQESGDINVVADPDTNVSEVAVSPLELWIEDYFVLGLSQTGGRNRTRMVKITVGFGAFVSTDLTQADANRSYTGSILRIDGCGSAAGHNGTLWLFLPPEQADEVSIYMEVNGSACQVKVWSAALTASYAEANRESSAVAWPAGIPSVINLTGDGELELVFTQPPLPVLEVDDSTAELLAQPLPTNGSQQVVFPTGRRWREWNVQEGQVTIEQLTRFANVTVFTYYDRVYPADYNYSSDPLVSDTGEWLGNYSDPRVVNSSIVEYTRRFGLMWVSIDGTRVAGVIRLAGSLPADQTEINVADISMTVQVDTLGAPAATISLPPKGTLYPPKVVVNFAGQLCFDHADSATYDTSTHTITATAGSGQMSVPPPHDFFWREAEVAQCKATLHPAACGGSDLPLLVDTQYPVEVQLQTPPEGVGLDQVVIYLNSSALVPYRVPLQAWQVWAVATVYGVSIVTHSLQWYFCGVFSPFLLPVVAAALLHPVQYSDSLSARLVELFFAILPIKGYGCFGWGIVLSAEVLIAAAATSFSRFLPEARGRKIHPGLYILSFCQVLLTLSYLIQLPRLLHRLVRPAGRCALAVTSCLFAALCILLPLVPHYLRLNSGRSGRINARWNSGNPSNHTGNNDNGDNFKSRLASLCHKKYVEEMNLVDVLLLVFFCPFLYALPLSSQQPEWVQILRLALLGLLSLVKAIELLAIRRCADCRSVRTSELQADLEPRADGITAATATSCLSKLKHRWLEQLVALQWLLVLLWGTMIVATPQAEDRGQATWAYGSQLDLWLYLVFLAFLLGGDVWAWKQIYDEFRRPPCGDYQSEDGSTVSDSRASYRHLHYPPQPCERQRRVQSDAEQMQRVNAIREWSHVSGRDEPLHEDYAPAEPRRSIFQPQAYHPTGAGSDLPLLAPSDSAASFVEPSDEHFI